MSTPRRFTFALSGVALALCLSLTACQQGLEPGPLEAGGSDASACLSTADATRGLFYFGDVIRNGGDHDIVFAPPRLYGEDGLVLSTSWMIPLDPDGVLGSSTSPATTPYFAKTWPKRQLAEGYVLAPGESANVIVELRLDESQDEGTAAGVALPYESDGRDYENGTTVELVVASSCS